MKKGSTLLLRAVLAAATVLVVIFCILVFPVMWRSENLDYMPIFLVMNISAIPVLVSFYQAWRLLDLIDQNKPFSEMSLTALKRIKYSALAFAVLYIIAMPYIYYRAEVDDAPGPLAIVSILTFGSIVVATFTAVLQKLVQNGVDLKSENDLTV